MYSQDWGKDLAETIGEGNLRTETVKNKILTIALTGIAACGLSAAQNNIYGNNAGGTDFIFVMTPSFAITQTLTNLNASCVNGRGIVVVSGVIYYTCASGNSVYSYTLATNTDHGVKFTVASAGALSTMAYDGTNFWLGDYGGKSPGAAYLYTPAGTLLKTVTLADCTTNCDGLEYFLQGGSTPRLISNRGDAVDPYDIYDINGNLITASFITTGFSGTGIAYDGTNFLVSEIYNSKIAKYSGTTGSLMSETTITGITSNGPLIEDLSADYAITIPSNPTGTPGATPAPSTLILMLCGIAIVLLAGKKLLRHNAPGV